MKEIRTFKNEYAFLSNFYRATVHYDGLTYPTSEHTYQAHKTFDLSERKRFTVEGDINSPGKAKSEGRKLEMRDDWDKVKDGVMLGMRKDAGTTSAFIADNRTNENKNCNFIGLASGSPEAFPIKLKEIEMGLMIQRAIEHIKYNWNGATVASICILAASSAFVAYMAVGNALENKECDKRCGGVVKHTMIEDVCHCKTEWGWTHHKYVVDAKK